MRYPHLIAAVAALLLSLPLTAAAQDNYTEHYTLDIQAGEFVGRLYEVLTREEWLGSIPEVRGFAELAREMGAFNLSGMEVDYHVVDGKLNTSFSEHYSELPPESYYGQLFALPNEPLQSASYMHPDNFVLYLGAANLPAHAFVMIDQLGRMAQEPNSALHGLMGDEASELSQGLGMVKAFNIEQQVNEILSGEVALALFDMPSPESLHGDFNPESLSMAAFIGLRDASRLRELAGLFGPQAGLTPMAGEMGEWTGYHIPGLRLGGIMFNNEIMIVSPNIYAALERIDFGRTGLQTPAVQFYADVNLARLHDTFVAPLMHGLMGKAPVDLGPTAASAAYLFALPATSELGHLVMSTSYDSGYHCEMSMNTGLANYLFYYLGVGISGIAQSEMN